MAKQKREKEINGKKILYKYGPGCWLTILLSLAVIAIPVLLMFVFPFFESTAAGIKVNGLHTVLQLFQRAPAEINTFLQYAAALTTWSWLAEAPGGYIIVAMSAVLILALVFAFVMLLMVIIFLLGGKLSHRKGPFTMSIWVFVMVLLYCAFPVTLLVIEATKGVENAFMHYLYDIIAIGASLILMIALYVVYAVCMKDRLFFRNAEAIEEYKRKLAEKRSIFPGQPQYAAAPIQAGPASNVPPVQIIINTGEGSKTESVGENELTVSKADKKGKANDKEAPAAAAPAPQPQVQQFIIQSPTPTEVNGVTKANIDIPRSTDNIGGHAFSKNTTLLIATIPSGIKELGNGAFANCINLRTVTIPVSVKKIGYNCFFNCARLERINYQGTKKEWSKIVRGSNWLSNAGTTFVNCRDARLAVDPLK